MLSPKVKEEISKRIQFYLQTIKDFELPDGEISFILHIDGNQSEAWTNIRNMSERDVPPPEILIQNFTKD